MILQLIQYVAEKVHFVWLSDGEVQVLLECKGASNLEKLLSVHVFEKHAISFQGFQNNIYENEAGI